MSNEKHDAERTPDREERVEALFLAAVERPLEERAAFVRERAQDDTALAEEVLQLLARQDDTDDDSKGVAYPLADAKTHIDSANAVRSRSTDRWIGRTIGPGRNITICSVIGAGGMGAVYRCEQHSPRRIVAVKILREAIPSDRALRRFEFEAQTLARMDHPGIARIHAADVIDEHGIKIPYFVMAYIEDGMPLLEYADKHEFSMNQRLELFRRVCDAVGHAHLKGVLHRDLKPANVLVDKLGRVKVIDFGVARAIDRDEDFETMFQTQAGHVVGTPRYMAPEQFDGVHDLDARVDVYALGVLLYELLCHRAPYEISHDLSEIRRTVLEVEPMRPASVDRALRGDIEAILLKALEKERDGRYRDAIAFGEDIDRHLHDEPVSAQPPTLFYTLRKVARRNRPAVGAAGFALLVLLLAAVASTSFFLRERTARSDALIQAERAEARSTELQQVVDFQSKQLAQVNPEMMAIRLRQDLIEDARATLESSNLPDEEVAARVEALAQALAYPNLTNVALKTLETTLFEPTLEAINTQFADQPLVRAQMLQTFSTTTRDLGLLELATEPQEEALAIYRRDLGDLDERTLSSNNQMGTLLGLQGKNDEALSQFRKALDGRRQVLGDDHPRTLISINNMGLLLKARGEYQESLSYLRAALDGERQLFGDGHRRTLASVHNIGIVLTELGEYEEAGPYLQEALDGTRRVLGDHHPSTLKSINQMGFLLKSQGKHEEALSRFREALEGRRQALGDDHPSTLTSLNNMGLLLRSQAKYEEALVCLREALDRRRRILGNEHPHTLSSLNNMGGLLQEQGKYEEALSFFREALEGRRQVLGDDHPETLSAINNIGVALQELGRYAEAESYARASLTTLRNAFGDEHPKTLTSVNNLALLLKRQEKLEEAESFYREALEGRRSTLGHDHAHTLTTLNNLAILLGSQGKFIEAQRCMEEAIEAKRRTLGNDHPNTLVSIASMASLLHKQGKLEEAAPVCEEALRAMRRVLRENHAFTLFSIDLMARILEGQGYLPESEALYREALSGRQVALGDIHPQTLQSLLGLASVLHELERHDEALVLAEECEAELRSVRGPEHAETVKAVKLLVELHEARHALEPEAGHDEEARRWRLVAGEAFASSAE